MDSNEVQLALGTVQFGLKYGIAGRTESIPSQEAHTILRRAWELGIRVLDTAPVYGNIEAQLLDLIGELPFSIVSKIPSLPHDLSNAGIEDFVSESINQTEMRLSGRLSTLLFHRSADLLDKQGDIAWQAASSLLGNRPVRLGVSCYTPNDMIQLQTLFPLQAAQLPGNAFDQRLKSAFSPNQGIELHLRSAFLQGVLLLSVEQLKMKLPIARSIHRAWRNWCHDQSLTPLQAALAIVKGLPHVRYCVVGVDSLFQLEEIVEAWSIVSAIDAPQLATNDEAIIDPRRWILNA